MDEILFCLSVCGPHSGECLRPEREQLLKEMRGKMSGSSVDELKQLEMDPKYHFLGAYKKLTVSDQIMESVGLLETQVFFGFFFVGGGEPC